MTENPYNKDLDRNPANHQPGTSIFGCFCDDRAFGPS